MNKIVALRATPSLRWIAYAFHVWKQGDILFPIPLRLPSLEFLFQEIKPDFLITEETLPSLPLDLSFDGCDLNATSLLLMTSGSTGRAKIARLSLANLIASAKGAIHALDLRKGDRWLMNLPLYHVGGIGIPIRCALAGAEMTWNPNEATHLSYVPTQLFRAVKDPCPPSVRSVLIGGAPLSSSLYEKAKQRGWPLFVSYGLTEMSSLVLCTNEPKWEKNACLLGFPLPGREIRVDPQNELLVRGDCLFQGYTSSPSDSPGKDWFPTGDLGRKSSEGFWIFGRKDWQFISGGENIQPEEIEEALSQFPEIEEALIAPKPDPEFGHRPILFARFKGKPLPLTEIKKRLLNKLPSFKIPIALFPLDFPDPYPLKRDRKKWIHKASSL